MDIAFLAFLVLSFIAVVTAVMVVIQRNPVHSAIFLMFTVFSVAGVFVLAGAEFLAAIQIVIYAGAIIVLFLFTMMLLDLREVMRSRLTDPQKWVAIPLAVLLLMEVAVIGSSTVTTAPQGQYSIEAVTRMGGNTQVFGKVLYYDFLLPFEVASLVLLLAIIGAIALAGRDSDRAYRREAGGAVEEGE